MTNQNTNRDLESPNSNIVQFYLNLIQKWLSYGIDFLFGYAEGSQQKPAILLTCGNQHVAIDVKSAVLLRHALEKEPELLDIFLDDWLPARQDEPLMTSGSNMPRRRVSKPSKAKAEPEPKTEVVYSIDDAVKKAFD